MTAMTVSRDGFDDARAGDASSSAVVVDYAKLMALLSSPHAASLQDRHAAAVNRVLRVHEVGGGLPLKELDSMEAVVRFVFARFAAGEGAPFEQTLASTLRLYQLPFLELAASDTVRHADSVTRALALIAESLDLPDVTNTNRIAACDAIRVFVSPCARETQPPRKVPKKADPSVLHAALGGLGAAPPADPETRLGERRELAARADVATKLLRALSVAETTNNRSLRLATLRAVTELSRNVGCASQMATVSVFDRLTPTFSLDFRDPAVFLGAELAWNVLEAISDEGSFEASETSATREEAALPHVDFFVTFADLARRAAREAHGDADKDLRNELFVVARLLGERGGAWRQRVRESGITRTARAASTIPEWCPKDQELLHPSSCATPARERDFEMKRLGWLLICELASDKAGALDVLGENGNEVTAAMLAHLAPSAGFPDHAGAVAAFTKIKNRWSKAQLFDLQTLALTCLTRLVPFAVGAFASAGAIESAIAAAAPDNEAPSDGHDPRRAAALAFLERACVFGDGLNLAERVGGSQLAMDAALWQLDPGRTSGGSSSGRDGSYVSGHGDTLGDTLNASARQLHGFAQQSDHDASFVSTGEVEHFAYGAVTVAPGTSLFGTYGTETFIDTGRHDNYGVPGVDTRNSVPGVSTRHGNSTGRDGAPIVRPRVADNPAALAACALLSALCDGDARNFRRLRRAGGVATLLGAVRALADTDAAVPIAFGAATIRAVWRCVVPDQKNCATFVAGGGVGALLSAAARCHPALRPALLSILADVFENPKTHFFFHDWRSSCGRLSALAPTGAQAVTLVLNLWRCEGDDGLAFGFHKTNGGKVGGGARESWTSRLEDTNKNSSYVSLKHNRRDQNTRALDAAARRGRFAAVGDAAEHGDACDSIRTRVFAVCSLLGFDNLR